MYALDCGMGELAYALKTDPVALRRANDTMKDPASAGFIPAARSSNVSSKAPTLLAGRTASPEPPSMRDGDWLVGGRL